ncbi:sensor histidine kinase [Salirhabdus sp. Marseille-P4669]|uniref:sensor histidine kinase n=1 Tax=Salirhabdus sp. Marseille-P4669 TaxID=2042310 RepID=UPI000C7B5A89|nr:sensor histidine kinase [Salirhabdus sp. Marseille-P4669]
MKSIRSKLMLYFFSFVVLFNIVSVSIYFSSNRLLDEYHHSFERFLTLNTISQTSMDLYDKVNAFVLKGDMDSFKEFYEVKTNMVGLKNGLSDTLMGLDPIQFRKYNNMIETFIQETEMTAGFLIQNDMEQYTYHLKEARETSSYIQETTLSLIDLELTEYQSFYQVLQERNQAFKWFTISLFVTTVLLAIFVAIWFSRGINRPIRSLWKAAGQVSKGNFIGPDIEIKSNDELKLLGNTFNDMRRNIQGLIEEIKEKSELDRLYKELELKHLQNQINPHFLFNTLNTIARMSYLEDARSTTRLIESVSSILRHSLGDISKSVTLKSEVEIVEDYFIIQKTRFVDRIQFVRDLRTSHLDISVPRLTLQPLIENAFIHGIEEKEEGGMIVLKIYDKGAQTIVEVSDNGKGMSEEQIDQLLHGKNHTDEEHQGHSTGLGFTNVIRRLQLFYQQDHIVEIESTLGEGTTIRLFLPQEDAKLNRGGEIA